MNLSGNTILIARATSGIGRALAERFANAGNHVIIAGRRQHLVDEIVAGEMRAETGSSCAPCCARRRIQADVKRDPRTDRRAHRTPNRQRFIVAISRMHV
jgi:NAD(P)-dependent dehydrogenase (short-subunit alcohol dehydrogenase family)